MRKFGLDWRLSLALECSFYIRVCRNWKQVTRARLRGAPFERFDLRGGAIITFTGSPPWQVFQEIWRKEIYSRAYPRAWQPPQTVVDVGANIGFFSLYAASRWHPARILAVEPAPENVRALAENIRLSRAAQIHVCPRAVAGSRGAVPFYLKRESGWHGFSRKDAFAQISVETTTLADIVLELAPQPIDFLKIDCEGAEYDFLREQETRLAQSVRFIAMEYHETDGHQAQELIETISRAGYKYTLHPEPRWRTGMLYACQSSPPASQ